MKANHELNIRNQNENCFILIRTHKRQLKKHINEIFKVKTTKRFKLYGKKRTLRSKTLGLGDHLEIEFAEQRQIVNWLEREREKNREI
jgi:hypothetical protein